MALKLIAKETFEVTFDGKTRKIVEGQELVGEGEDGGYAAFVGYKHPNKVELVDGVFIEPKFDAEEYFEKEKVKEDSLKESLEEDPEAKKELARENKEKVREDIDKTSKNKKSKKKKSKKNKE